MSYYISPIFLDKLAVHITKSYLDLPGVKVPLILGIHGRKGEGKTFQCELVFERMGVEVVHVSGGEFESPDAGDPARLIRLRYREAAELSRTRGTMSVLMINDLDAGAGRFDAATQYTVNTQLVNSTLMNIADNPTNVQLPGSYDDQPLQRTPILVTGNDFATLYAPLVRDGRMEKFYWEPTRGDRLGIVGGIFALDGLSTAQIEQLVDTFADQSIDFYSALRSRIYDEQIRDFIHNIGIEKVAKRIVNSTEAAPHFPKPNFSLEHLIEQGRLIVREQRRIQEMRLVHEYNSALSSAPFGARRSPATEPSDQSQESASHVTGRNRRFQESAEAAGGRSPSEATASAEPSYSHAPSTGNGNGYAPSSSAFLSPEVVEQVRQLVNQGYRIGLEHVNERRFRTNSWQTCATLNGASEQETLTQLNACLEQFPKHYVRLIGIDPHAKRRVLETIIQRP
ncbi:MAG: ribulose bisphosphate carboxylase small subunit [Elainellaceae cyanobacterium]